MSESLTSSTIHGLKWSYVASAVTFALQIGVTAVLARLLTPSAFGLVAMAGVFLYYGRYFAMLGAGQAVIQKADLSTHDMRTAFTSSLLMGATFCILFIALAPLASVLFPDAEGVVAVTRVMSLSFLISGLSGTTEGLLLRRFAFRAIALAEIGSWVVGYALVGLVMAVSGFGVWSLVAASLSAGALIAIAYTFLCRHDVGLSLNWRSFKAIYSFGGRVSLIGVGQAVASTLDTLWAGHYLGAAATGLYTRATNLASVPLNYFLLGLARVLMPGYSRLQHDQERLKSVYIVTIRVVAAIGMPVAWGIAGASRQVILTLLGDQWTGAVPVLAILALAVPFTMLTHISAIMCEATANLNVKIAITAARIAWLITLLAILSRYGVVGIAVAFAVSELITHLVYLPVMRRMLGLGSVDLWNAYSIGLRAGLVTGLALFGLSIGLSRMDWPVIGVLAVQLGVGGLLLLGTLTRARGGEVWHEIRHRLDRAGYGAQNTGPAAWIIRRVDAMSGFLRAK